MSAYQLVFFADKNQNEEAKQSRVEAIFARGAENIKRDWSLSPETRIEILNESMKRKAG